VQDGKKLGQIVDSGLVGPLCWMVELYDMDDSVSIEAKPVHQAVYLIARLDGALFVNFASMLLLTRRMHPALRAGADSLLSRA